MANKIQLKRSSVAGRVPATTDLDLGELALNTRDGKLYTKTSNGSTEAVVQLSVDATVVKTTDSGTVTSAMLADGTIVNGDINASAAIAGTKISPDFGGQNVTTTGSSTAASFIPTSSTVPSNGVYLSGTNTVAVATNSAQRLRITDSKIEAVNPGATTEVSIGAGATGNNFAVLNLIGDTTYTNFGTRLIRGNGGENTYSFLVHRGTGELSLVATDAGVVTVKTQNTERLRITSDGKLGLGTSAPGAILHATSADNAKTAVLAGATNRIRAWGHLASFGGSVIEATNNAESAFAPLLLNGSSLTLGNNGAAIATVTSVGVGIGTTAPQALCVISNAGANGLEISPSASSGTATLIQSYNRSTSAYSILNYAAAQHVFTDGATERVRIDSAGYVGINNTGSAGGHKFGVQNSSTAVAFFNRLTDDGTLVTFFQDNVAEGTISVSGTTVSYNGAHLSRWSQLPGGAERNEILRGTVLSNIDEMCGWGEEDNEQLNRMKVSDVEGDPNVSGVFQGWDDDDDTYTDDFYCAMTGDFIIRIAEGVTVQRGDLLMSAGDGTAKPQDDDIIRSKTIAKVTSTHITCTYDDGSYCVPCVLMAC